MYRLVISSIAVISLFVLSPFLQSGNDTYVPVHEEVGIPSHGNVFSYGFQVSVNHFGGNLLVSNTDVTIPGIGDFGLFFSRTHNSNLAWDTEFSTTFNIHDSPMGLGWTSHYGYLLVAGTELPVWRTGSGGREIMYPHDALNGSIPIVGDGGNSWISTSFNILYKSGDNYILLKPNGLRYTLTPTSDTFVYYPTLITDANGNTWDIYYRSNSIDEYKVLGIDDLVIHHPLIAKVSDDLGRDLNFNYTNVNGKDRIQNIRLENTIMSSYTYQDSGSFTFLKKHTTGAGRQTIYTTDTHGVGYGTISDIQLDTGGQVQINYAEKMFYYQGANLSQVSYVYAVTGLYKDGAWWGYTYPNSSSSSGIFSVTVDGPGNFTGTYSYITYGDDFCNAPVNRIGTLVSSSESYNGSSTSITNTYSDCIVSNYVRVIGACAFDNIKIPLMTQQVQSIDGTNKTTNFTYDYFDSFYHPQVVSSNGKRISKTYRNLKTNSKYYLGLPLSEYQYDSRSGGDLLKKTIWNYSSGASVPYQIRTYTSSNYYRQLNLTYYNTAGKRGAIASSKWGNEYQVTYNYANGTLSSMNTGVSSQNVSRTINLNGTIASETHHGITKHFGWDLDYRLTSINNPGDSDISISYGSNNRNITQGSSATYESYNSWGRLSQKRTKVIGSSQATTSYSYDSFGRISSKTLPTGITFSYSYDVFGRVTSKTSSIDDYSYDYDYYTNGFSRTITTKNGSQTYIKTVDAFGRIEWGETNSNHVDYSYDGPNLTIFPQGQNNRLIDFNLISQKVGERHPESGQWSYGYNSNGWLTSSSNPVRTHTYNYNTAGQLLSINNNMVIYNYDGTHGYMTHMGYAGVSVSQYDDDSMGRPQEMSVSIPQALNGPDVSDSGQGWPNGDKFEAEMSDKNYFKWGSVAGASYYEFELNQMGAITQHGQTSTQLNFSTLSFEPDYRVPYKWRVRGKTSSNGIIGPYSPWVTFQLLEDARLEVGPTILNSEVQEGDMPTDLTFEVWNAGDGVIDYTLSEVIPWLDLDVTSGQSTGEKDLITCQFNAQVLSLGHGTFSGSIEIVANGQVKTVTINLTVLQLPLICANQTSIIRSVIQGNNADSAQLKVWNCGGQTLQFDITHSSSWLTIIPSGGGSLNADEEMNYTIQFNTTALGLGQYTDTIQITETGTSQTFDIAVTLNVVNGPSLCVDQVDLYQTVAVGEDLVDQSFDLWNCGNGSLTYNIWDLYDSVEFSQVNGTITTERHTIVVSYTWDDDELSIGDNELSLVIDAGAAGSQNVTLHITVYEPPLLTVNPSTITVYEEVNITPATQYLTLNNTGGETLSFNLSEVEPWLSVFPSTGTLVSGGSVQIAVDFNPTDLTVNTYTADIEVTSNGGNETISVFYHVTDETYPEICSSQSEFSFYTGLGANPDPQTFEVWNCSNHTLNYTVEDSVTWLSATPSSGSSTGEQDTITLNVYASNLPAGTYNATVSITGNAANSLTLLVTLEVFDVPQICTTTELLSHSIIHGEQVPSESFQVWNCGDQTLTYTITETTDWFSVSVVSGTSSGEKDEIQVDYTTTELLPGTHVGIINISGNGDSQQIEVQCVVETSCDNAYLLTNWLITVNVLDMIECQQRNETHQTSVSTGGAQ
ncbi:MAG: hypothetical protein CR997_05690 [Acidobacteria bacterium]|nr:MAG: hypothetical protein CR997_05690 [Acidobacteriota bacterium]